MADPTDTDHLATVRAALGLADKATEAPWRAEPTTVFDSPTDFAGLIGPRRIPLTWPRRDDLYQRDAAAIAALRNAAPAIGALADECEEWRRDGSEGVDRLTMRLAESAGVPQLCAHCQEAHSVASGAMAEHVRACAKNPLVVELRAQAARIAALEAQQRADRGWLDAIYTIAGGADLEGSAAKLPIAALRHRVATLEAELAQARAHRCVGIVLSAEDADRIAALLEEQPGPTPAMVALFDKAKE